MSRETYEGAIQVRGKGTGFFALPDNDEDIVIESENLSFALDSDIVKIELLNTKPSERQAARVLEVLKPAHSEFVGTVKKRERSGEYYLSPDNHRIHIRLHLPDATKQNEEMKVVTEITSWKNPHTDTVGKITETI